MRLSPTQIDFYTENGYLMLEKLFSTEEIQIMLKEMDKVLLHDSPGRILEKNGSIRSFFAPEKISELYQQVIRLNRLVSAASQLLGTGDIYVHQTKLNIKKAMIGDWWEWHRDYTFWQKDDGMPEPEVLTAMIFLNDTSEFNGPLLMIPGSHVCDVPAGEEENEVVEDGNGWFGEYQRSTTYMSALTSDLKYTLKHETLRKWAAAKGITSAKGAAGSVLFFHGNLFHASSNNLSPWDRYAFLITYNTVANKLPDVPNPRPEFIASRKFNPIVSVEDDTIFKAVKYQ